MKGTATVLPLGLSLWTACVAPISTRSSPEHITHVEIENATDAELGVSVEMAKGGIGEVSYDGRLRPGEIESLYLRYGLDYVFSVTDAETGQELARREYPVWAYTNLVYDGEELVLGESTVEVAAADRVLVEPRRTLAPLYAGVISGGFAPAEGSVKGSARLVEDKRASAVFGVAGEARIFSDYLAIHSNVGYSPGSSFQLILFSVGPMVKFRPLARVDPYTFLTFGLLGFMPKEMQLESGEEVDPKFFANFSYDFGGGILFGLSDNFALDTQGRLHAVRLDPVIHDGSRDFDNDQLFVDDTSLIPEFRIGIRYSGS